jgi:3-oxoacyl-[acyl-carrier-protein] synthase II
MTRNSGQNRSSGEPEVWITGLGLISSLGEGGGAHWALLAGDDGNLVVDETSFAPYPVHPLGDIDFSAQIERKSDLRQMGPWQRIGVYAAGLALENAGLAGRQELLDETQLIVAAGNGERDEAADGAVLKALADAARPRGASGGVLNKTLQTTLRPTLYLAELSNLLAGNISIVHGVSGSSRTYKGEEMAGVSAVEDAVRRIVNAQGQLFLVGGAFNAERADLTLAYELSGALWNGPFKSVWERGSEGGGFVMGSLGAFLVLEADAHARARGKKPYAKIAGVASGRSKRSRNEDGAVRSVDALLDGLVPGLDEGPLCVLSGASGVEPATGDELSWLDGLENRGIAPAIRAYGTMLGHSVEAHFPAGLALAALAVSRNGFFRPFDNSGRERPFEGQAERILVTGWGHWRGEGLALVETAGTH